jgi:hypothetical protein
LNWLQFYSKLKKYSNLLNSNSKLLSNENNDRGPFDQKSVDQNCVFSVDRNFHNQLTKILDAFQLIEKSDQLPKKNLRILAVDQNFNNGILSF